MLKALEAPLTPAQEAQLRQIARTSGCGAAQPAQDVLSIFLERDTSLLAAVLHARQQIERGDGVPHEDVVARLERHYGT